MPSPPCPLLILIHPPLPHSTTLTHTHTQVMTPMSSLGPEFDPWKWQGRRKLPQVVLWPQHTLNDTCKPPFSHTQINVILFRKKAEGKGERRWNTTSPLWLGFVILNRVIAVITASHDLLKTRLINNRSYKGKRLRPEDLYIFKETDDKGKDISQVA